jgi:pyruvate/2-oxoacid:ferredoxin oxidoreductase alpha subunit
MEQQFECQFKGIYTELRFNEEDTAKIAEGQFPLILAKDGVFTKLYVSETELDNYGIFDALDEDAAIQQDLHGPSVPIVWVRDENGGMTETGIEHKVIEQTEE